MAPTALPELLEEQEDSLLVTQLCRLRPLEASPYPVSVASIQKLRQLLVQKLFA